MGKFDLDDLVGDAQQPVPPRPGAAAAADAPPPGAAAAPERHEAPNGDLGGDLDADLDAVLREIDMPDGMALVSDADDPAPSLDLGQALLARNAITAEQLATAARVSKQSPGRPLRQIFIELGIDEVAVQEIAAEQANLPFERIEAESDNDAIDARAFNRLGGEFCKSNLCLPLRRVGSAPTRLVVGTTSPDDVFLLDDVKRRLGIAAVKHVLVTASDIRGAIELLDEAEDQPDVDEILADVEEDDVEVVKEQEDDGDLEDAESSPVVRFVNHIIHTAMKEGASDIHIEPHEKTLTVRFRIDGVLFEMMNPPRKMHAALTSRLKIMANLDIAERRLPQDGRIRVTVHGRKLDLRLSTVPTPYGEKAVMRILDTRSISVTLDQLGFSVDTLTIWKNQIDQPHGIILVTGPTGSGKTTTLYASIKQMDTRKLNVSTVEDPVEYNLQGITQIQTHERIGMTFAKALKALLRQDPDVIMVGEIRDMETATIAIQAALTGHLVLSTLHTNDAPASITRLINIGIEPFLVGAAVNAVLAQRLVRRICDHCKRDIQPTEEMLEFLTMHGISAQALKSGAGCPRCRETGYSGRSGLYELLVMDDSTRDAVARNPNVTEFRRTCSERGMVSLREDGFKKVAEGATTVEEVLRVTEATI